MKKRMTVVILIIVFCMGAALSACGPDRVSIVVSGAENLSCIVGTETKNIRNVKIAVKYSDDSVKDEVAISDPAVSLSPAMLDTVGQTEVEVSYKGFKTTFDVNVTEENYMITLEDPTVTKYRSDATLEDVDLTGGRFNLFIGGQLHGEISYQNTNLKATMINLTDCFVAYEYDLSDFDTEFEGKVAKGRFDITVGNLWPASIKLHTLPSAKSYAVKVNSSGNIALDTADVDLSGGILTVTYNDSTSADVILPDEDKVSVLDFKLDESDYNKGVITLKLISDIAAAQKITCEFSVDITDHNDGTIFSYYASLLPESDQLDWNTMPELTGRQNDAAMKGIELYLSDDFAGYRETYKAQKTKILTSYVYTGFNFINAGIVEFETILTELLSDRSKAESFIESISSFCVDFDKLLDTLNEFIAEYIYVAGQNKMVLDVILIFEKDRAIFEPYLIATSVAAEVFDALSVIPDEAWNLDLNESVYAAAIESAYSKIVRMLDSDETETGVLALRELLLAWRWDSIDIIYDYYYDASTGFAEDENVEINKLFYKGVMPQVFIGLINTMMDLMEFFCYNEHIVFVYSYTAFEPLVEKLDMYEYKTTPELFEYVTVETIFHPARLGMVIGGKDEMGIYKNIPLTLMREAAETIYAVHYEKTGDVIKSSEMLSFIADYGSFLLKWMPTTHWVGAHFPRGNANFDRDYERIATRFNNLSIEVKNALLNYLDLSPRTSTPTPVFRMMSDAYLESRLNQKELQLYNETFDAYKALIPMLNGMRKDNVTYFVNKMKSVTKLYDEIEIINPDFVTCFGEILDFCLDSNNILSKIPAAFYPIMELIFEAEKYYANGDMTNFGKSFRQLDTTLATIFDATSYTIDSLKEFSFNGISMYDQFVSLKELYEALD